MKAETTRSLVRSGRRTPPWGFWRALKTVWSEPRLTVRQVVRGDAAIFVIAVAWLSGILDLLQSAATKASLEPDWGPFVVFLALVMGPLAGLGYFAVGGWLVGGMGRLLGGDGDSSDTRVALACGTLAELVALPFWVPVLALYGFGIFTKEQSTTPIGLIVFGLQQAALWLWAWVLRIRCVAEVHGFSLGRATMTVFLSWLCGLVVVAGVALAVAAFVIK